MIPVMSTPSPSVPEEVLPPEDPVSRRHWEMLVISCLVVAASGLMTVYPNGRVGPCWSPEILLPPLCMSYQWFNVRCPGCGLTRCFIHLAHGDWHAAYQVHRVGWVLFAATLLQIPYRILCLRWSRCQLPAWASKWFGYFLVALLIGNWLVGMLLGWDS
jgi:hypothetical protein